jgi:hypothetical protein
MKGPIYYLPGHGGVLQKGLGAALLARGHEVMGRETVGEFNRLPFGQQVEVIAHDLTAHFAQSDAQVIANSFGAYLFMHAQAQMPPFAGRVLLLSPIVGEFGSDETQGETHLNFIPPRAGLLYEMAKNGTYPVPQNCEFHVGSEDWQSNPANVLALAQMWGVLAHVVPGSGHAIDRGYINQLLDRWLT